MEKTKGKTVKALWMIVLSVMFAVTVTLAVMFNRDFRASAQDPQFSDIVRSEKLKVSAAPANKKVPSEMDGGVSRYMERVFQLGLGATQSTYKITSLSQGSDNAKFAPTAGTEYEDGDDTAFYISSDMVTKTSGNSLFTTAGTTMSFSKEADTQSGYFVFDFRIGGELLDAAISSDQLFGLLGMTGSDIGLPFSGDISGHFNTAQLFYKVGDITDDEMNDALTSSAAIGLRGTTTIYIAGDSLDDYSKSESAETFQRAAWITDGNDVATSSVVSQMEDGWYQARIPVGAGSQNISLGLTFGTTNLFSACVDTFFGMAHDDMETSAQKSGNVTNSGIGSYFVIRNVDFREGGAQGTQTDSVTVTVEGADAQSSLITANVGEGAAQTNDGSTLTLTQESAPFVGQKLHLKLDESKLGGKTFYGFDVGGVFYGGTDIYAEILNTETAVRAIFGEADTYAARVGTKFYPTLEAALDAANQAGRGVVTVAAPKGQTVTLGGTHTVEKGVTLVLPYDETGSGYASGIYEGKAARDDLSKGLAWQDEAKYLYTTVELSGDLTVNGKLVVGGVVNAPDSGAQSRTSGAYAELKNSGSITVNGEMNVYGRVTGDGKITVTENGKLAEPFLILDYTTGENAADTVLSGLLDKINGNTTTTPFLRYALANVENTMTVQYGGQLYGYLSLYALGRMVSFNQPIVGTEKDNCFMMLSEGASVEISYDGAAVVTTEEGNCTDGIGKTSMNFTGGAKIGALSFTVFGVTFDSEGFVFSIPYNFDITLGGNAVYELTTEFMVMPGATLTLGAGATLNITHTFWTLEGYQADKIPYLNAEEGQGKAYPAAEELAAAGYSKSGNFIVNGELNVGTDGEEIAFLGIVQTTGSTGRMTLGSNVDTGATGSERYEDFKVQWNDMFGKGFQNYPTAAGQFDAGRFIFTGKVRQARDALAAAQPQIEWGETDPEAEAAAFAIRFFLLVSPARVYDGLYGAKNIEAGSTYIAKRDAEWTLGSYKYISDLSKQDDVDTLLFDEYEIDQIMHGGWKIEHEHTEDEVPQVDAYVAEWDRGFYQNEYDFGENEPCKPVVRYHNALGCEEQPDTKLLVNPNWELHVPYMGGTYSLNECDSENLSLYDIIKSSFFQHIVTAYPEKIDWAQYYINREDVETDEAFQNRFGEEGGENPYLHFKVESADGGDIKEPGEYTLNVSFLSNDYYSLDSNYWNSWEVSCGWFCEYDEEYGCNWDESGTIKVVIDPVPLLSAEDDPERWEPFGGFEKWQNITVMCSISGQIFDLSQGLPAGTDPEDITVTSILVQGMFSEAMEFYEPFWETYPFLQYYWYVESYVGEHEHYVENDYIMYETAIGNEPIEYNVELPDPSACVEWDDLTQGGDHYLTITGDGKYVSGTYKYPIKIRKTMLKSVQVLGVYAYEGEPVVPEDGNIIVKDENDEQVPSSEYDVAFQNNDGPGQATIIVTAKQNSTTYEGTVEGTFTITIKKGILTVNVSLSTSTKKPYGLSATFSYTLDGVADLVHYYTRNGKESNFTIKESVLLKNIIHVTSEGASSEAMLGSKYNVDFEIDTSTPYRRPTSGSGGGAMSVGQASTIASTSGYIIDVDVLKQIVDSYEDIIFVFEGHSVSRKTLGSDSGTIAENAIEIVALDLSSAISWQLYLFRTVNQTRGLKVSVKNVTYDGNEHGATITGRSGYKVGVELTTADGNTIDIPVLSDVLQYDYGDSDRINVGTVHFKLVPKEGKEGIIGSLDGGSFEITPKEVTVASVEVESSHTYNGQVQTPTLKVTLNDTDGTVLPADQYTATYDKNGENTVLNAGTYSVTIAPGRNYTFADASVLTTDFTVLQADIAGAEVSVKGRYIYNGAARTLTPEDVTVTLPGIAGDVTFTIQAGSYQNNINASKDVNATFAVEGSGNFMGTASGSFAIEKKPITVTASDINGTYGDPTPSPAAFTVPAGALEGSDKDTAITVTLTLQQAEKYVVGEYAITGTATADNYEVTVTAGKYIVGKKTVTVTILGQTATYNGDTQAPTSTYGDDWTVEGLVAGDEPSALNVLLSAEGCKDVGDYTIKGSATATNYNVTFAGNGTFSIGKKAITVTATNVSVSEGATEQYAKEQLKFTVDGLYEDGNDVSAHVVLEIVGFNANAAAGESFTIKVSFGGGYTPKNYEASFKDGRLTINASVFEDVVFNGNTDHPAEYDGTFHTLTASNLPQGAKDTYTYLKDGQPLEAQGVKDAGNYQVKVTITLEGYKNYEKTVNFVVSKKKIEISAADVTKTYGDPLLTNEQLTFNVADGVLVGGDERTALTVKLQWPQNRAVGDYDITGTATADNYDVTVKQGTYHIGKKAVTVTIQKQAWATYNGQAQTALSTDPYWTVEGLAWDDTKSVLGVTLSGGGTNAGGYDITGSAAADNYDVSFSDGKGMFVIAQKSIEGTVITVTETNIIYKASQWQPAFTAALDGFADLSYDVSYGDNVNAGTAAGRITLTGNGNFCGEASATFDIVQKSIETAVITVTESSIVYKASQWQPAFTVKLAGFETVTYAIGYGDNVNAGENAGSITLTGNGNFCGEVSVSFTITPAAIDKAEVTGSYTYTGKGIEAAVEVSAGGLVGLVMGDDFTVIYNNNINAGEHATAEVTGRGNYRGTVTATFTISPKDISDARVTVSGTYVYNGSAILPKQEEVSVTLAGFEGITFGLTAENNVSATVQAKLTVTGTGNYCGSVQRTFRIEPKKINVTLLPQTFAYSGKIPTPDSAKYTVNEADICSQNGVKDDLGITIDILNGAAKADVYGLTATAANKNYTATFNTARLTIEKKAITVKADDITVFYGDPRQAFTFTANGVVEGEDPAEVLHILLQANRTIKDAGEYTITGTGSADNYTITVEAGTYTVKPKEITVTIGSRTHLYDGKEPAVPANDWSVEEGAILSGDNLHIVLKKEAGVGVRENGYAITGEYENGNYHVTFVNGTYTILPRAVTVEIEDQNAIYNYKHEYRLNAAKWHVAEGGDGFAAGETADMLGIALATDAMTDAGSYAIRGSWTNQNYTVTFAGAFPTEGEEKGSAGIYSVAKMDVSDEAIFILGIDGHDVITEAIRKIRTTYAGDPLSFICQVTIFEGDEPKPLTVSISPVSVNAIGNYTATVTIEDINYCGSTQFTVIVTDADGYTQNLKDTLVRLSELGDALTVEDLTVEDFAAVKEIAGLLSALDETERKVAGDKLAHYEALVEGWKTLADLDAMIETAETIADAPIAALFGAAAVLTALIAACYVIGKGGLL